MASWEIEILNNQYDVTADTIKTFFFKKIFKYYVMKFISLILQHNQLKYSKKIFHQFLLPHSNCSILAVNDNLENKLLSPLKYYRYFSLTRTWPHALHLGFNCWSRARHPVWRGGGVSTPSCPVDYRSSTRVFTYRPLTPFGEATVDWKEIIKKGIRYVSSSILFLNNFPSSISSY